MSRPDALVVGGGIIGLASAWRLAAGGARVRVVAGTRPAATRVAAGMLTPVTEAYWGEEALTALALDSLARWPAFAERLEGETGADLDLRLDGVLAVGFDADDRAEVDDLHRLHEEHGLVSQPVRGRELRAYEPLLAPPVRRGFLAPGEGAVDPRRVHAALGVAVAGHGVAVDPVDAAALVVDGDRVVGVRAGGDVVRAGVVVLAAGAWSPLLDGVPDGVTPPVHPVYGEVVRLGARGPAPRAVVRAVVRGRHVYVVPRSEGEIVVGATSLERGYDTRPTAGGVYELLRDARAILPALDEAELVEVSAGLRPGTPDNAPLVGWSGVEGLFLATGHHRNGILLAPVTADAVVAGLAGRALPEVVATAADPARFREARACG